MHADWLGAGGVLVAAHAAAVAAEQLPTAAASGCTAPRCTPLRLTAPPPPRAAPNPNRDHVKKVALYKGRLAVHLPSRIVIYELASGGDDDDDGDDTSPGMKVRWQDARHGTSTSAGTPPPPAPGTCARIPVMIPPELHCLLLALPHHPAAPLPCLLQAVPQRHKDRGQVRLQPARGHQPPRHPVPGAAAAAVQPGGHQGARVAHGLVHQVGIH